MSEPDQPQPQPQPTGEGQQQVQLLIDEREARTVYSNGVRFFQTPEEVVMDLGFNMQNPNPGQLPPGTAGQIIFKISDRVIMSYPVAKRLAGQLTQLIKRYEQQFGEIPMQPGRR